MSHELWVDRAAGGYGHGSDGRGGGWPGLRQVVLVRTRREFLERPGEKPLEEDHFYLTSLRADCPRGEPQALLRQARCHWQIENTLHHKKDRSMGEDAQRARPGACVMARLRSLAVGLLPYIEGASTPIKQVNTFANPLKALRLLKRRRFPRIT